MRVVLTIKGRSLTSAFIRKIVKNEPRMEMAMNMEPATRPVFHRAASFGH